MISEQSVTKKLDQYRSWKRIQPKIDEEGFMKVDENMELPFD